jgi:hypothetical protein
MHQMRQDPDSNNAFDQPDGHQPRGQKLVVCSGVP